MDVEMLKLVESRLGIHLIIVSGRNWSEVYGKVQTHDVDMLSGVALTPERTALLNFTEPYINFPVGIITRNDGPFMLQFPQLEGHRVAMPRDYAPTLLLQRDYPKVHLVLTETTGDAFQMVSRGDAFATMDNLASASYLIKDRGLANLKVAGITDYGFALRYGVRKDWPEFPAILQKALGSISARDLEVIKDKWINLDVDDMVVSHRYGHTLLLSLGVFAVVVLLVLIWNWTLAREVARRKAAELELREARNKAVDANQMKSAFLANLSHEIRNPLDALLGFTDLLKQEATDRKFQKYVDAIDVGGRTLLGVINDVLDLSKVEAGRLPIHLAPVDLRGVLNETRALFAERASRKGLEFDHEVDAAVPPYVLFDQLRLRQILYNTVGNAIKFTDSGSVRLGISFAPNSENTSKGMLTVSVMDTGIGIPPADQQRIFEPFAQREGQSPLFGGTGLGLAISKRLTELMGGRIEMESQTNRGSTFRFIFPNVKVASDPQLPKAPANSTLADFECLKVLIVDDLESNRELLKEYFVRAGHQVWEAGEAETGLILARNHAPHLIFMDIHLPGMNGHEAARKLRQEPSTADIPLIFLSGSTGVTFKSSDTANIVVLAKPLAYENLVAALRELIPHAIRKPESGAAQK